MAEGPHHAALRRPACVRLPLVPNPRNRRGGRRSGHQRTGQQEVHQERQPRDGSHAQGAMAHTDAEEGRDGGEDGVGAHNRVRQKKPLESAEIIPASSERPPTSPANRLVRLQKGDNGRGRRQRRQHAQQEVEEVMHPVRPPRGFVHRDARSAVVVPRVVVLGAIIRRRGRHISKSSRSKSSPSATSFLCNCHNTDRHSSQQTTSIGTCRQDTEYRIPPSVP